MVFHGLLDYGYTDLAKELAQKTFNMAFVKNKTTREYYNAETGAGNGLNPFWGWSTLAYFMPFEYELKYDPTALKNNRLISIGTDVLGIPFAVKNKKPSEYAVSRMSAPIPIDGNWDKPQWQNVKAIEINNYMGGMPSFKPTVQAKMMYDDNNLYVIFKVDDAFVRCNTKEINGPVWEDNCVEFFFSPDVQYPLKYFNLEINCGGVPLMHYNAVASKEIIDLKPEEIKDIEIAHSYTPVSDEEIPGPLTWTLEYKIPLALLEKYANVTHPGKGVSWRANYYKIAHKSSNPHYMSWSFVDIDPKDVDMHTPEFFGELKFE